MRALVACLIIVVLAGCGGGGGGGGVGNGGGGTTTPPPATATAPTITTQPQTLSVNAGSGATFTIAATGNGTLSYQWLFDGTLITGATSSTLTVSAATGANAGSYTCTVTNTLNGTTASATSSAAVLTVVVTPSSATLTGESAVLPNSSNHTVSTTSQAGATYLWSVSNGTIAAGQGTSQVTYSAGSLGQIQIALTISNQAGTVLAVKNVVVVASLPIVSIFAQPNVLIGSTNVTASTPVASTYGWTLAPGTTAASVAGQTTSGVLTYNAGTTVGSLQLTVNVADAAGNSATASQSVGVISNTFLKDPRDVTPRSLHSATLLHDGRVLVVGGDAGVPGYTNPVPAVGSQSNLVATAELFDPATSTWAFVGSLPAPRFEHSATLLNDGRVLVVGGSDASGAALASTEIYNAVTQTWSAGASMASARALPSATLLSDGRVLVAGGINANGVVAAAEVYDPTADSWSPAGTMISPRVLHSATLLPNGQVLVAGGRSGSTSAPGPMATAERYDPTTNAWTGAAQMLEAENAAGAVLLVSGKVLQLGTLAELYDPVADSWAQSIPAGTFPLIKGLDATTAVLLSDGRVLATGGYFFESAQAAIYDPVAQTWISITSSSGSYGSITELQDGRTLVVGGVAGNTQVAVAAQYQTLARAAVFDPTSSSWATLGSQAHAGAGAAASVLADGRLVATGGSPSRVPLSTTAVANTDVFDPTTNTWTAAAPMSTARATHTQTTLLNGSVMVTGGSDGLFTLFASAEMYNPAANSWSAAGSMTSVRYQHTATLLTDGTVLAVGGSNQPDQPSGCSCTTYLATADRYNPTNNTWAATGPLTTARYSHTATLLTNGKVLITGGFGGTTSTLQNLGAVLASAEIYDPIARTWSVVASMNSARMNHTATLLPSSGLVLVAGGTDGTTTLASAEVYDPVANTWTPVASLSIPRQLQGAQVLSNGDVLIVGGLNDFSSAVFGVSSAEFYDPVANTWSPAGSLVTARQNFIIVGLADGRVIVDGGSPNAYGQPEFYH